VVNAPGRLQFFKAINKPAGGCYPPKAVAGSSRTLSG
jgi:hypothetical protein